LSQASLRDCVLAATKAVEASRDELSRLDAAAGDGDHGVTMALAARAVRKTLDDAPDLGGEPLVTRSGERAPTLDRDRLAALEPEVVIVKPCGFGLRRTLSELPVLREALPRSWRARVYAADGNAYFNRPGPRIVESLEIMAACVHPDAFEDFAEKHAASWRSLSLSLV